jgi:hypothetical protein
MRYELGDCTLIIVNNLAGGRRTTTLDMDPAQVPIVTDLFSDRPYGPLDAADPRMQLEPYGYRWLRIGGIY